MAKIEIPKFELKGDTAQKYQQFIYSGDWVLAHTLAKKSPLELLEGFALAVQRWICPVIKQMQADANRLRVGTLKVVNVIEDLVIYDKIRVTITLHITQTQKCAIIKLPCPQNGNTTNDYMFSIFLIDGQDFEADFLHLFVKGNTTELAKLSMAARWLKEFRIQLPK